ncbi:MAG: hypothetical protein LBU61_04705 [Coriobacteriales bacterium]|jgi:hypothetical protein|nr:hypothetical protein [Coriobacteriales bacterium]
MKAKFGRILVVAIFTLSLMALVVISGCTPKGSTEDKNQGRQEIETPVWSMSSNCTSCHIDQVASMADAAYAAFSHMESECISCHLDIDDGLTESHQNYTNGKDPSQLKLSSIPTTTCMDESCHDYGVLGQAGADSTAFNMLTGKQLNPHHLPNGSLHYQEISCSTCHKVHAPAVEVFETATEVCGNCHHKNSYSPCAGCHTESQ